MANATQSFVPALIVVDLQEDFCPPNGSLAVPGGRDIAPTINSLLALPFDVKVGTQDYHPPNHISFTTQHEPPNNEMLQEVTIRNPSNPSQTASIVLWPVHCVQSTPGAELIHELNASTLEKVVRKGLDRATEMYSGFSDTFGRRVADGAAVADCDLGNYLKELDVTDVFVCGLTGDCCVKSTALDAAKLGFKTVVVSDAVRSIDEEKPDSGWVTAKKDFKAAGVELLKAEEIAARVKASISA